MIRSSYGISDSDTDPVVSLPGGIFLCRLRKSGQASAGDVSPDRFAESERGFSLFSMNNTIGKLSTSALLAAVEQESRISRARLALKEVLLALFLAGSLAMLCASLALPIFRIHGTSMSPALSPGDLIVCCRTTSPKRGDIIAFYYNNRILVKRVIALPGETVEIREDGTVLVDGRILEEPYLAAKAKGSSDLKEALTVPKDAFFVLGDERATSIDSRRTEIGCVKTEQLAGKVLFIFPGSEDG